MYHTHNEKRKMTIDGVNRTTKSRKNQNDRRKKTQTYKYLGILEEDTIKQEEKRRK